MEKAISGWLVRKMSHYRQIARVNDPLHRLIVKYSCILPRPLMHDTRATYKLKTFSCMYRSRKIRRDLDLRSLDWSVSFISGDDYSTLRPIRDRTRGITHSPHKTRMHVQFTGSNCKLWTVESRVTYALWYTLTTQYRLLFCSVNCNCVISALI